MSLFLYHLELCAPLFLLVFIGWGLAKIRFFPKGVDQALSLFTFRLMMPALLFKLMSHLDEMPPMDARVLVAFFAPCLVLFFLFRHLWQRIFLTNVAGATVLSMAGIFGNTVQLGVPIVQASLGSPAMPTISLLIIFNVLILWTLAIASVEFGRAEGPKNLRRLFVSTLRVFRNPVVLGILLGTGWGLTGWPLPEFIDKTVALVAAGTTPVCLIVVGMGLAQHSFMAAIPRGAAVTFVKLVAHPFLVWLCCRFLGIGVIETQATVLLAAFPVAVNVYLMATEFEAEGGGASNGILLSTLISAAGVPLVLTLLGAGA